MELSHAVEFARTTRNSVLTALRRDGRPQLSNVLHVVDDNGLVLISITADRAKYHNLRRTPWAALHVTGDDFRSYAVLECEVDLTDIATDPHDAAVEALIAYYRAGAGEHPDWDDYRRAMVADRRVLARLTPVRAYGLLREVSSS
ncbi:PPOX class F420-dependent oxidoreductase [Nocardia higoensis]|uniref:PPOX class F420-dependent oxidoreductase n=1 Tax=Nocardia higoensis TaxID=228599 RepID=UPI00030536EB|nr:PPOX class F420-dependent oxidoreductase [Nocardia higoensis]